MKKKGTTESYSFLIGIIIAFLMLMAIGCAVYNIYKPKGANSFNRLALQIKDLEKKSDGEGELTLFLEKDQFIVGFNKDQEAFEYSKNCPSNFEEGLIDWGCYGVQFLKPKEAVSIFAVPSWWAANTIEKRPMKILKPNKCSESKSCLCLCKMDELSDMPYAISEKTCTESTAICTSFDIIEFTGGEECCEGAFIPGTQGLEEKERGLRVIQYKKVGNRISLGDILFKSGLEEALEGERQKITQLQQYLKTKKNIFFIPVNWNKDIKEFDRAITAHYDYTEKKIKALEKKTTATIINKLSDGFNIVNLKEFKECTGLDLSSDMEKLNGELKSCLTKAYPEVTEEVLKESKIVGITDDDFCGASDAVNSIITKYDNPQITAHEWGHLMRFCDEYKYSEWKWQNEALKKTGSGCMNPYPVCCEDHPYWTGKPEEYKAYLEKEKIGPNCFPHYQDLGTNAKERFKTKEEYEQYVYTYTLCHGHVCKSEDPKYKYCRGIMGPVISCANEYLIYDNSLDYSYFDLDRTEDFDAQKLLEKQQTQTTTGQVATPTESTETVIEPTETPTETPPIAWDWSWPVETLRITSCYGGREGTTHAGIDVGAEKPGVNGDPIYAVNGGVVRSVMKSCPNSPQMGCGGNYGNYVIVNQDDGLTVIYAHLMNEITLKEGDRIVEGSQIGKMGSSGHSTGTHLHLGAYVTQQNSVAAGSKGSINPTCMIDLEKAAGKVCPASTVCPFTA